MNLEDLSHMSFLTSQHFRLFTGLMTDGLFEKEQIYVILDPKTKNSIVNNQSNIPYYPNLIIKIVTPTSST